MPERHPDDIRQSLATTREELTYSLNDLQSKVTHLSDWRRPLRENRQAVLVGAGVAGFVLGGGLAAVFGLFRR